MEELGKAGIATRSYFYPLDQQPAFSRYTHDDCPNAATLGATGLYLPSGQTLDERQVDQVCNALHDILNGH